MMNINIGLQNLDIYFLENKDGSQTCKEINTNADLNRICPGLKDESLALTLHLRIPDPQ